MSDWQDGYEAGYQAGLRQGQHGSPKTLKESKKRYATIATQKQTLRKASAYSKRYGKAFKRLAPKYKKKGGGWKKNGFKRCAAAALKVAKK